MKMGKNQRFPLAHTTLKAFSYTFKKSLYARKLYRDFIFKHRILYQKIHTEKNVFMSFPSHRGSLPSKRCVSVSVQQVSWLEIIFLFPFPYRLTQYSGSESDLINNISLNVSSFERVILLTVAGAAAASHCIPFSIYPASPDTVPCLTSPEQAMSELQVNRIP